MGDDLPAEDELRSVLTDAARQAEMAAGTHAPRLHLRHLSPADQELLLKATANFMLDPSGPTLTSKSQVHDSWARLLGYADQGRRMRLNPLLHQVFEILSRDGLIAPGADGSWIPGPSAEKRKGPLVARSSLGAWLLKANPQVWDLKRWVDDGGGRIDDWTVAENYRSQLMSGGDRVFLWVSGHDPQCPAGVRGHGVVTGPCRPDRASGPYWLDRKAAARATLFAQVDIQLLHQPLHRHQVQSDPALRRIEVLRAPYSSNPSFLTPSEVEALDVLISRQ